ncbi:glutathione transferase [Pseudomonas sp. 148P]|uniref:Glutathione transferase n=1 Tax=Pseudomonas ulcerans TaxID=3115852 RepID=A0ABU7HZZ7_9PSED|nr:MULTISPECIES: glutathione transferase [unclassified Pseudomonas]MEE1925782.1 glutathione transferase [Pseudomonas sp. 147P]MEE1937114.1 glutathione transferase [Pseudomonas sp. 148P]
MSQFRLYVDARHVSPYAMSVYITLREKGLDFDTVLVDLDDGANQADDYARLSLTQRVPTLLHNGFALSESSAITEYLEDLYPGHPVYPRDPQERARVRQVQAWLRSDLVPIREQRSTMVVFCGVKAGPLSAAGQAAARKLIAAAEALLPEGTDHLAGHWSIADVELAVMLNRLVLNGDPLPARLKAYAERQWQRPSVQEWVNKARPPL